MSALKKIMDYYKAGHKQLLMFDYDGTLVPIAEKPDLAVLDEDFRRVLEKISLNKLLKVAIISGRSISDLQKVLGLDCNTKLQRQLGCLCKLENSFPEGVGGGVKSSTLNATWHSNITIYGMHGGETLQNGVMKSSIPDSCKEYIEKLRRSVDDLASLEGIIMEDKGYALSLHYRLADQNTASYALKRFSEEINNLFLLKSSNNPLFRIQKGKKVIEILPVKINKGGAVKNLIEKFKGCKYAYFGDDKTDFFAFEEINKHKGLAIFVGNEKITMADEVITINQLRNFLREIAEIKE